MFLNLNSSITISDKVNVIIVNFMSGRKSVMHKTVFVNFIICVNKKIDKVLL